MPKIQSKDLVTFEVDEKIVRMSGTLDSLLRNLKVSADDPEPIPLPTVDAATLEVIIQWAQQHINDHPDEENGNADSDSDEDTEEKVELPAWDKEFLGKLEDSTLFELITAANYLELKKLLNFACKFFADKLKNMTPEMIRSVYDIEDDLTEEEKAQIREENAFCSSTN